MYNSKNHCFFFFLFLFNFTLSFLTKSGNLSSRFLIPLETFQSGSGYLDKNDDFALRGSTNLPELDFVILMKITTY